MRALAIGAALLALFAGASPGLAASGAVHEQAGVTLIEIPVTVLDHDGKPVRGLTAADFDVRDEGKSVPIQSVDVTEFSTLTPGAAPAPAARNAAIEAAARRRFVLLFDLSFSTPSRITRIRDAARKFVTEQMGPDDLVAVATYSIEHGFNLVVTFTPDRAQLASAVETLGRGNTTQKASDPLQLMATIPNEWAKSGDNEPITAGKGRGEHPDEINAENKQDFSRAARRGDDAYRKGRVSQLLESFGMLARALDSVEGRKQVIYFSQGFDVRLLQGNSQDSATTTEQNENAAHGAIWTVDSQARFGSSSLQTSLNTVLDLFKRSDCVIHSVDLSGISAGNDENDPSNGAGQASLFAISEGTGGELFNNANDFSGQLAKLLEAESVVYVLTFSPKTTGHPGQFHTLKVKVQRSGVRVSSRPGYYEPKAFSATTAIEKNLTAADVIASEIPVHEVPVSVSAQAFAGTDLPMAMVQIEVPAAPLLAAARNGKIPIEVYAYAFDATGKVADFSTQRAVIDATQVKGRLEAGGLRYFVQLKMPPGAYRMRTLVRESDGGAMGFAAADLTVPDFGKKTAYLVEPLAMGSGEGLILRGKSARGGDTAEFPFMAGPDPFLPDSLPATAAGKPLKLCLFAYSMGDPAQVRIGGQLLDGGGKPIGDAKLSLVGHSNPDALGKATYLLAWNPEGLAPGKYRLRIVVQDPSTGSARQATTPIEVR
jgi:VWFA-related protein